MREILFRGKRINNGEWVEGSFLLDGEAHRPPDKEHLPFSKCYIVPETDRENVKTSFNNGSLFLETTAYHVIPETVGQYTGLTDDKNGRKVFEGDILKFTDTNAEYEWIGKVEFGNPNEEYNWGFQLVYISGTKPNTDILLWFDMEETGAFSEVIGNIHDNPELLEVSEGG